MPRLLQDRLHLDLSREYVSSVAKISGIVHRLSSKKLAEKLESRSAATVYEVADILAECGWDGVRLVDEHDFEEAVRRLGLPVKHGIVEFPDGFETRAERFMNLRAVRDIYAMD